MSKIILFNGVCNTCCRYVQFVIKQDKKKNYLFASFQSEFGIALLKKLNYPAGDLKSIALMHNNNVFIKSTARLKIAGNFNGLYKAASILLFIPRPVRDFILLLISKKKHKAIENLNQCLFPYAVLEERFIMSEHPPSMN